MTPSLRIMKGVNVKGNPKKKRNKPKNIDPILTTVFSFISRPFMGHFIMYASSINLNAEMPFQTIITQIRWWWKPELHRYLIMGSTYRPIVIPMTATTETNNKSKINLNLTIFQSGFHQTFVTSSSAMSVSGDVLLWLMRYLGITFEDSNPVVQVVWQEDYQ